MSVLGNYIQILGGGTPNRDIEGYWEGDVPWATVKDLTSKHISETYESITERGVDNCATQIVPAGTLLIATRMALGRMSITNVPMAFNQDLKALVINGKVDQTYLYYFLFAKENYFISRGNGATVKGFKIEDIRSLPFAPPALPTQRRIAAILDKAQALVANDRRTLAVYDQLAKSLFLELFGDPVRNERGWETVDLGSLCEVVRGSSPRPQGDARYFGGPVPRLMVADLTRDGMYVTPQIDSLTIEGSQRSRPMKRGDLVMAVSGKPGLPAILMVDCCIHDGFAGFRDFDKGFDLRFIYHYLNMLAVGVSDKSVGAIFKNITTEEIRRMRIPLVPLKAQERFGTLLHNIQKQRTCIAASLHQSEGLFGSLLQGAFRGELGN
ncbi:MAG: restriction endonuclease subunit S [Flavobacteriales bacterium]|nr:restriction endonuclease subunit S [Flavobacteriales bacterium]MBP9136856.1 restriction endonuclease subunit S [Flavobacteriales bacterium]HQV51679.1 restriction endonuclease subunit S [Flavobacteriales bacterium]HQX29222.1 restriction endonuclease subunit S [Flavobacteriales bacterium]HQX37739.1 restriction endonuclease subunit S [Flavobacteriales bacterium]